MKRLNKWWFSLIELLVVITILAIISVVAYTNFSGSTGKAKNSKKLNDITSIETWLQTFYQDKNYYPMPSIYDATTNIWWYDNTKDAQLNNTLVVVKTWDAIDSLTSWAWGWKVYIVWWASQAGAKWVIDSTVLNKQYLSQELVDPSLKDIKIWNDKTFKDFWVWKYIYWVFAKPAAVWSWNTTNKKGSAYNIAITLTDDQKWYLTKIIWNFDNNSCTGCPKSLIWPGTADANLVDWDSSATWSPTNASEKIPYPVEWF